MKPPEASKAMTRHHPVIVHRYDRNLGRDTATPMWGENLCGAPSYPGCTTALDCLVGCAACIAKKGAK